MEVLPRDVEAAKRWQGITSVLTTAPKVWIAKLLKVITCDIFAR